MKTILKILALFFCIAAISCGNNNKSQEQQNSPKRFVRKNVYSKDAQKDLEALEKALEVMRQKDCSDPLSWYYQGGIHWVPDTVINNKLCSSYQYPKDKKDGWDNCTHTKSGKEAIHFLVWHRLYIYHFEKIVRKLSGYNDFALPYWGYTNRIDIIKNRTMPEIFRNHSSSLYEESRFDSLNKGYPISGVGADNLSLTKLFKYHFYYLFNKNLNVAPHGAMHDYIGYGNDELKKYFNCITQDSTLGGLMEQVKSAAFDPIFWVHHSNIDRLWQQWTNIPNGQLVTLEELKEVPWPYVFFDENGKKVEYKIEDVIKILYTMDYDFDDTKVYEKKQEKKEIKIFNLQSLNPNDTIASKKPNVKIKSKITKLSIPNDNKNKNFTLLDNSNQNGKILIMSVKVSFTQAPKGSYQVYLNLPKGENANPESKYFSGFMTFFGADHHHSEENHSHHNMDMSDNRMNVTFTFEITPEAISSDALSKSKFDISILKFNGLPNEEITIDDISITKMQSSKE